MLCRILTKSVLKVTLRVAPLFAICFSSLADTVVAVTDQTFPRNEAMYTLGGPNMNAVAISWTQTTGVLNATIVASLQGGGVNIRSGTAYLMNAIGPSATAANEVVAPVNFSAPAPPPNLYGLFPLTTLFTGLQLNPGTYYLVITASQANSMGWAFASYPLVTKASSVTLGGAYTALGSSIASFVPASNFGSLPSNGFIFDVVVGSQVIYQGDDTQTHGKWIYDYGSGGYVIPDGPSAPLDHTNLAVTRDFLYTWAAATSDPRALQLGVNGTAGIASAFTTYSGQSFNMNLNVYDNKPHTVGFYLLDWDTNTRIETLTFTDAGTGQFYDFLRAGFFNDGLWVFFLIKGNIQIQVTPNSNPAAVINGVFID